MVATETQTNVARTAVTNPSGHYVFANMKDGLYRVETELSGFKKFSRDGVRGEGQLDGPRRHHPRGRRDDRDGRGRAGDAAAPDRPRRHRPHDRGPTGPGAAPRAGAATSRACGPPCPGRSPCPGRTRSSSTPRTARRRSSTASRACRTTSRSTASTTTTRPACSRSSSPPPSRSTPSTSRTSNFDAEFGRAGGSVTTVVLKSGTNQFRGSVFAFGNTESTQARSYFASSTSKKPETKYQQFGATLGRPDHQGQALLLHRLPAHGGQPRPAAPRRDPADRVAERRLLDGQHDHLRPGHRQPGRHGADAASPATSSPRTASARSRRAILAADPAAEHPRRRPSARSTTSWRAASARRRRTPSTSS